MYTLHKTYILALLSLFTASNSHADSIKNSRRTAVVEAAKRIQLSVVSLHVRYRERVSQLSMWHPISISTWPCSRSTRPIFRLRR